MWPTNALTKSLNLKWPILQAPMGSASTPTLAAAVTNAGGLGGLGMWGRSAEQAARRIAGFRQQSGGSLNVNYPIWPDPRRAPETSAAMRQHLQVQYDAHGLGRVPEPAGSVSDVGPEHVAVLLDTKPEMVSFHFGLPETEVILALKSAGIFILSSATTVAEARLLEQRGVDAIIAQGTEAGGHRGTFTGVNMSRQRAASPRSASKAAAVSTSITRFGPIRVAGPRPARRCGSICRSNTTPTVWGQCPNPRAASAMSVPSTLLCCWTPSRRW